MTDGAAAPLEAKGNRRLGSVLALIRRRPVRKGRVQAVPDALRSDVGLERAEPPRQWWEYR